ncbi:MAG TPA: class I adenylate-forming enzyme family protein, partial [Candidatus Dormibacteraeota bacterium]
MLTVPDVLRRNHARRPLAPAVVDSMRRLSHRQLAERAWAVAGGLRKLGVRSGDTVAILCGNGVFSAETILGAMAAGAVAVPLSWRWSAAELEHGINDSRATVLLGDDEHAPAARELMEAGRAPAVKHFITEGAGYDEFLGDARPADV